jgi:FMN reductase
MNYLVISTSLSPRSKSRILARAAAAQLETEPGTVEFVDLAELEIPFCDAAGCYSSADVIALKAKIEEADGIVLATPIYNYTIGSSAKNLIELTGKAWTEKVVAFLCAAGGPHSYMSVMTVASSLMLDFRSVIVPRFVYAMGGSFADGEIADPEVEARIEGMTTSFAHMTRCLRGV